MGLTESFLIRAGKHHVRCDQMLLHHPIELAQRKKYIHVATLTLVHRLMYALGFGSAGLAPTYYIKVA